jgi:TonB family protein
MAKANGKRSGAPKGAQTAAAPAEEMTRVLRLAAAVGPRVLEERYVREKRPVTVGQDPTGNVLSIPLPELPRSFKLFDIVDGEWALLFTDAMDGRVSLGGKVAKLSELKSTARNLGNGLYLIPLPGKAHGKVVQGSVTFLFQFVSAPASQPKIQLPRSVKGTLVDELDHVLVSILAASLLLHFGFLMTLRLIDFPEEATLDRIPDRFVSLVVPDAVQKKPEEVAPSAANGEKKAPEQAAKPKADKPRPQASGGGKSPGRKTAGAGRESEGRPDAAAIANAARNVGVAKMLLSAGDSGGALGDLLRRGDPGADGDKVFDQIGGVVASTGGGAGLKSGKGGGTGRLADIRGLRGSTGPSGGGGTGSKGEAAAPRGVVKESTPDVDGTLDANVVAAEIRRRLSAIKICYERELKRNPDLGGKVVVRFEISTVGRVSSASVESTTIRDAGVEGCILSAIRSWRFPAPSGGSVEVAYPFVLAPSR